MRKKRAQQEETETDKRQAGTADAGDRRYCTRPTDACILLISQLHSGDSSHILQSQWPVKCAFELTI